MVVTSETDVESSVPPDNTGTAATNDVNSNGSQLHLIMKDELYQLIQLSIPIVANYVLEILPGIVSLILVGHIQPSSNGLNKYTSTTEAIEAATKSATGTKEDSFDAVALAITFIDMTAIYPGLGMATAMATLCPQAHGALTNITKNDKKSHKDLNKAMSIYFQTGLMVMMAMFLPVAILNIYCAEILIQLGQPEHIAILAGDFVKILIPGIPFAYTYDLMKHVLQSQNIVLPQLFVAICGNFINFNVSYYIIYYTDIGYIGAAIGRTVSNICLPIILLAYLHYSKSGLVSSFWNGTYVQECLKGIIPFLNLGVPGIFMICLESWAFEILVLLSGLLPNATVALGSMSLLLNVSWLTYMVYEGITAAGSVRVGQALGANDPIRAQIATLVAILLSGSTAVILSACLIIFKHQIPMLFTDDDAINDLATSSMLYFAIYEVFSIQDGIESSLRGSGRQWIAATLNFIAYYIIGIPAAILLAFTFSFNVAGLWMGAAISIFVTDVSGLIVLWNTDWMKLADDAKERMQDH